MSMIDHMTFGVRDHARSVAFYDAALGPLGIKRLFDDASGIVRTSAYGATKPGLWLAEQDATQGKLHIAFVARDRFAVQAFHREALAAGGMDNGAPGYRPYHPGYYAAFVLDPDGHNIEAVFHDAYQMEGFRPHDGL